jgi:hypothetical protein
MESDRGGNINFENNESSQLNVICSPASSLDHSKPRSRLPSAFFITEDKVGQRFVVFHVPSDRKITVLKLIGPEGCFPEINEHCPPIRAYSTAPFLVYFWPFCTI